MSKDTKDRILDAAELLFCKNGIGSTSIRRIIAQADVNIAAIHYHFGCKTEVIKAVVARRVTPINQERIQNLEKLEKSFESQPIPVNELVSAFLIPAIKRFTKSKKFNEVKSLLGRLYAEPQEAAGLKQIFAEVINRFLKNFNKSLPDLSKQELMNRFSFMIGSMTMFFLDDGDNSAQSVEDKTLHLIQFVTAGFLAPNSN